MKSTDKTYENIIHQAETLCRVNKLDVGMSLSKTGYSFMVAKKNIQYDFLLTNSGNDVIVKNKKGKAVGTLKTAKKETAKTDKKEQKTVQTDNDNKEATS